MDKIIFILGPTSSGKSSVAAAFAERIDGEVVSCDSMQVYRDMDIVSQAPGADLTERVPHHLVRILSPEEEFSAAKFVELAQKAIEDILSRGRIPVFAGGTGLYVKALVDGLFESPPKDEGLRSALAEEAEARGNRALYSRLETVDPETAAKLHENDRMRIIRALEVFDLTGSPISKARKRTKGISGSYDYGMFALAVPREKLYAGIEARIDTMFDAGLVDEVRALLQRDLSLTARNALGIKEVGAYLDGHVDIERTKEELKKNTRRYAKRQLTWFRADKRICWIDADRDAGEIVQDIIGESRI